MNEQLKFSWGHIIAFVAIILISYVTFVGDTYLTDGDFSHATMVMVGVDLLLLLWCLTAQYAKATTRHFARWIRVERFFVFTAPLVFIFLTMTTYSHFWTVHSKDEAIVKEFTEAINASRQMFTDYDVYAEARMDDYQDELQKAFPNPDQLHIREAHAKVLELQLCSQNYDSLRTVALEWIDKANQGASTWNVFLLANKEEIKDAVRSWNQQLTQFSTAQLEYEATDSEFKTFMESSVSLSKVEQGLEALSAKYTTTDFPNIPAILSAMLLFVSLCLPYLLQERHTKSMYSLLGKKRRTSYNNNYSDTDNFTSSSSASSSSSVVSSDDTDVFTI